jgi:hypothetical protein
MVQGEAIRSVRGRLTMPVKLLICAALSCAAAAAAAPAAVAAPVTICNGELPFGSYDNVVVPPRATCSAGGSTVARTFAVGPGATLNGGGVTIGGSLIAQGAENVRLDDFSVGGDVIIRGGGGNLVIAESTVRGVVDVSGVNGFIAIINNDSTQDPRNALGRVRVVNNVLQPLDPTSTVGLNISSNTVRTDATVSGNTGRVDKNVQGNTVGGTLSCIGNQLPFLGTFNTAAAFRGQCRGPV